MNKNIEIKNVIPTTYEDGTCWIEYEYNGMLGYEISSEIDEKSSLQDIVNILDTKNLTDKIRISVCSDYLKELIENCRQSDNEMWFVTKEDLDEIYGNDNDVKEKMLLNLALEIKNLKLEESIEIKEDDEDVIVVYGGVITDVLFDNLESNENEVKKDEIYIVKNFYRYITENIDIDSINELVTRSYHEALKKFNELKEVYENTGEQFDNVYYNGKEIITKSYDDNYDGVELSIEVWNL